VVIRRHGRRVAIRRHVGSAGGEQRRGEGREECKTCGVFLSPEHRSFGGEFLVGCFTKPFSFAKWGRTKDNDSCVTQIDYSSGVFLFVMVSELKLLSLRPKMYGGITNTAAAAVLPVRLGTTQVVPQLEAAFKEYGYINNKR